MKNLFVAIQIQGIANQCFIFSKKEKDKYRFVRPLNQGSKRPPECSAKEPIFLTASVERIIAVKCKCQKIHPIGWQKLGGTNPQKVLWDREFIEQEKEVPLEKLSPEKLQKKLQRKRNITDNPMTYFFYPFVILLIVETKLLSIVIKNGWLIFFIVVIEITFYVIWQFKKLDSLKQKIEEIEEILLKKEDEKATPPLASAHKCSCCGNEINASYEYCYGCWNAINNPLPWL